jgi:type IV pilus assembly protein PilM
VADESIWKKEISFGRKRKEPRPEQESTDVAETASEQSASIWKKEVSFGRKKKGAPEPKAEEPVVEDEPVVELPVVERLAAYGAPEVVVDPSDDVQGSDPEPGPAETSAEESAWTKEVSFSRAVEPDVADVVAVASASDDVQGSDPEPGPDETSVEESAWTKEVSFSRAVEPDHVEEPPVVAAEASVEPVAEVEPAAEFEAPAVESDVADVVVASASDDVQGSDLEPGPDETGVEESTWTKEASFSRAVEPEHVEEQPVVAAEASVEPVAPEAPTESWSAKPSLPPEPVVPVSEVPVHVPIPAPQPGVHSPVTAEELPPLPKEEKKVPFWKKDLSFGGGNKAPKAKRAPKEHKERKPKEPRQPKEKGPKVKAERGSKGAKRIVGLKVGASQLAAARVANNGSAELLQVAREPLEPGIVVGGELRDPDALAEALKEFFAKHKLPKKGVRLGIANNRIGVRTFDVDGIDDPKQLTNAVRFRAQEALPIPIDEAVLDYQVLGEGVGENGQPTKRILLVVAYRELIDRYMHACKKAGISLAGIDLEAFALLRALQAPQDGTAEDPSAALVAVAIGHDRSTFAVSDGRICEFTRVLEWGGAALNVAIARALDAAPSEVDGVKRSLALTDEMVPESLTPEQAKKARDAMRRAIQTFARELVSSLQYYQNQPGSLGIGEIALTGGTAHLHGLAGELERLIGVRVRVGDPLARMKVSKRIGETEQVGSLAVAIGLGIED